ncbi:MAG: diguanylate cyclase [Acidimicrobiales bacterium]
MIPITVMGVMVTNLLTGEVTQRANDRVALASQLAAETLANQQQVVAGAVTRQSASALLVSAISGSGDLEAVLRSAVAPSDLDVLVVVGPEGQVVADARKTPRFSSGVPVPTAEDVSAGSDLAILHRAAVAGTDAELVGGRWIDDTSLAQIVRDERAELAFVLDGLAVASTAPAAATAAAEVQTPGVRKALQVGDNTFLVLGSEVAGGLLVASLDPPTGASPLQLFTILAALMAVMLVLVVLVGYVLSVLVTEPVQSVGDAARAVSMCDLSQQVEVKGDREVALLGEAFNEMTDNLRIQIRLLEQSRTQFRQAMARLGDVLVSTHDLDGIIEVVLEASLLTTAAEVAVFYDRVAMPARVKARRVVGGEFEIELNGTGVAGGAGRKLATTTFPGSDELDPAEPRVAGAVAVPVISEGRLFGVLAVYGRLDGGPFPPDAVETAQTLARQAEVAIGNVVLHDETRRQARTDGLTQLWNRREFELRSRDAVQHADRFGESFGIIMIDVDDFKLVNDQWDHTTGDAALIWLSARFSEATREVDTLARWGGEEFILLLPRSSVEQTAVVAERIRESVAEEPFAYGATPIRLTVSVGYGAYPDHGSSPGEVVRAADAALLYAKRAGKNRVHRAGDEDQ